MFRNSSFFFRLLGLALLAVLLIGGGALLYRAGQAQGYAIGAASVEGSTTVAPPVPVPPAYLPYYPYRHFGFFPFGICGLFFGVLLFFFALRLIFRPHFWGGPYWGHPLAHDPEKWHAYWHEHGHGPPPPWGGSPSKNAGPRTAEAPEAPQSPGSEASS